MIFATIVTLTLRIGLLFDLATRAAISEPWRPLPALGVIATATPALAL